MLVSFFLEICGRIGNEMPRKRNFLVTKRWFQLDWTKMGDAHPPTLMRTRVALVLLLCLLCLALFRLLLILKVVRRVAGKSVC